MSDYQALRKELGETQEELMRLQDATAIIVKENAQLREALRRAELLLKAAASGEIGFVAKGK